MSGTSIEPLTLAQAEALGMHAMTFPRYRRLLSLERMVRDPSDGDKRLVQPVGVVAREERTALGLVLAEQKIEDPQWSEMLSVYVSPHARNRGLGTRLVEALEDCLSALGARHLSAVYKRGTSGAAALERVLAKRGWGTPEVRAHMVRCTPEELSRTSWFGRISLTGSDLTIFPWAELTEQERAELVRSHEASSWIAEGLEPWRHDHYGFEPTSSVGLRYKGRVVGWIITHRLGRETVRFTTGFVRDDLARRGLLYALWTASTVRLRDAGCQWCTWVTPVRFKQMTAVIERRCLPWVSEVSASYGSSKELGDVSRS